MNKKNLTEATRLNLPNIIIYYISKKYVMIRFSQNYTLFYLHQKKQYTQNLNIQSLFLYVL